MNGTRKMRKSVSEFGRFQISVATFSGGGTTVGLARSVIAETASVGSMGSRQISVRRIVPLEDGGKAGCEVAGLSACLRNTRRRIDIPERATENLGPRSTCESGGIGRRAGLRSLWSLDHGGSIPPFRTNLLS